MENITHTVNGMTISNLQVMAFNYLYGLVSVLSLIIYALLIKFLRCS